MKKFIKISLLAASLALTAPAAFADNTTLTTQTIQTQDGLNLQLTKDYPANKPKAVLVIAHSLASHSEVFGEVAQTMNDNGIAVYRFDQRGHGKSDGRDKIHINSYFEMVDDLRRVVQKAKQENPNTPVFVLGHSMGGHITALYATKYPNETNGVILAAGVLRYHQMNFGYLPRPEPKDSFVSGMVALTTLNLPMPKADDSGLSLPNDPLMLEKFSVSFANSFKEGVQYLKDNDNKFIDSVLLVSSDADLYVLPQDAIDFYNETKSVDKSLRLYSHIGHLLFLEKGGDEITADIAKWISQRAK